MCESKTTINSINSYFFIGFMFGGLFFFFPDQFGRKWTMTRVMLPVNCIATAFTIFGTNIPIKRLGFFLQGMVHLKNTISYCHCLELEPERYKGVGSTIIMTFNSGSMVVSCFLLQYYVKSIQSILVTAYFMGLVATCLYTLFVPESPRWLFMNNSNSKEGIEILNYIAWFNGSNFRVPADATMDQVGQVVKENETLNNTKQLGLVKTQMNRTIQEDIKNIEKNGRPKFSFSAIGKQLVQLFCDLRNCKTEYMMMLLYFAQVNIYFFGLFNGSSLKRNGNQAQICMLWGISEVVGVQIGHRIQHYLSNKNAMILALSLIVLWNWVIKSYPWSEHMLLVLFMCEITCIGMTGNLIFTVFESRTNPKLLNIALEFNICFGNLTTLACPVIARMHEPAPTVYSTFLCLLGILVLLNLGPAREETETLEQQIEKSLLTSVMHTANFSDLPSILEKQMVMKAWRKSSSVQSS